MRLFFPNLTRPKKAAKYLSGIFPRIPLSNAQQAVAMACGYRDWHEFETCHATSEPSVLDEDLTDSAFHERAGALSRSLAASLNMHDGDVQAALPGMRLTGNRAFSHDDHEAIRIACWRSGPIPWRAGRHAGAIFHIKSTGFPKDAPHWWRQSAAGVRFINHAIANGACATFEAVVPRTRLRDFVPRLLWLPYGWMDMEDSSRVLFSRDYLPLWRIIGGKVERIKPTTEVHAYRNRQWFRESGQPWSHGSAKEAAEHMLAGYGITSLPRLADVLPILIHDEHIDIRGAAKVLDGMQE
ncbi:conserved hypothetical protein [uncultured Alphaproteobacteria bacterium]|uniref:Uncharacterized protein n=1 Tax=uncultured Alphaproteobacteria bacterium TaxID=91750 RepID=A0A212JZW3_9PROT|nr:conserved hypothetical protein [uncultured Alphaproteobacteria bacterium]